MTRRDKRRGVEDRTQDVTTESCFRAKLSGSRSDRLKDHSLHPTGALVELRTTGLVWCMVAWRYTHLLEDATNTVLLASCIANSLTPQQGAGVIHQHTTRLWHVRQAEES